MQGSDEAKLKRVFAKSLSRALASEKEVRSFLRIQSLNMMNEDYDVLYGLVKNSELSNGKTFRQTLIPFFTNEKELEEIESRIPLLTIFIPSLPENSFSAEKWNTDTEVPYVAVRLNTTNDVPIISPEGEEYLLDASLIPSYPIIVVKENERLISNQQSGFEANTSTRKLSSGDGVVYKFVDDLFDRELNLSKSVNNNNQRTIPEGQLDPKIVDAFNIYQMADGWQRDYVYYGITPSSPNGQFSYDFVEHIRSFVFTGDALSIYFNIADQTGDPFIKTGKKNSGWTDGSFEIRANILIQSKNGIGPNFFAKYLVSGSNLFSVT